MFTKHMLSIHAWQTFGKDTSLFSTSSLSWKSAPAMCEHLSTGARFLQPPVRSTQTVVRRCLLTGRVQDRKCEARETKTCERVWCFSKYLARGWGHSGCLRDPAISGRGMGEYFSSVGSNTGLQVTSFHLISAPSKALCLLPLGAKASVPSLPAALSTAERVFLPQQATLGRKKKKFRQTHTELQ